jgi:type I restriction enzyme M protein
MTNNNIVQKLWNLCDVLRDDGINYSDYVNELVLLLFIKMVHENTEAGTLKKHPLPNGCRWTDINKKSGINLLNDYKVILLTLSTGKRLEADPENPDQTIEIQVHNDLLIRAIYADAHTRLREPLHLQQMIKTLNQIDWFNAQQDGLGDLYEGLLEKNANETKSGAGQYFTPRELIDSIVRCIKPKPGEVIQDPAVGTAGFLISADSYIKNHSNDLSDLTAAEQKFQKKCAFTGIELVPSTRRLALMNCLLHGIEGDNEGVVHLGNALGSEGKALDKANIILANPPFGTSKGGEASNTRDDLAYKTSNKQLAFLQHIYGNLKPGGRAAVVLPDNVLFEAGVGTDVRQELMNKCNLHTILRLPTGIFYAHGVKTNVLFFTKGTKENSSQTVNCTQKVWIYDLRTNMPNFGKRTPFGLKHLAPFEKVYGRDPQNQDTRKEGDWSFESEARTDSSHIIGKNLESSRWRCFSREWIKEFKGDSLDITWLKGKDSLDASNLPEPEMLAKKIKEELMIALDELDALVLALNEAN